MKKILSYISNHKISLRSIIVTLNTRTLNTREFLYTNYLKNREGKNRRKKKKKEPLHNTDTSRKTTSTTANFEDTT